jgi:hypothetical protein
MKFVNTSLLLTAQNLQEFDHQKCMGIIWLLAVLKHYHE